MSPLRLRPAVLVVALLAVAAAAMAPGAAAKKKSGRLDVTSEVNQVIPVSQPPVSFGNIAPTITAGRKFKGRKIRDVNVTIQTTGSAANAANSIQVEITAPNGATQVLAGGFAGQSVGPVTFDDETPFTISGGSPCPTPFFLCEPYVGSVRSSGGEGALATLDGGPVRGTWTLQVLNFSPSITSVLNSWRLNVVAGRPYRTK